MILSERVRLRAIEREDLPRFVAWLNDPEVRAGLAIQLPVSFAEEEKWFEKTLAAPPEEHPLAIDRKQDGGWEIIGSCGFHQVDWRNRGGEVGIVIGEKSCWNQGYGTEAIRLLLRHGFETLNLHRICLRVYTSNKGALRSYEKAGFVREGCLREAVYLRGKYEHVILLSMLRNDWALSPSK